MQCCQLSDEVARFSNYSDTPSDFFPKKLVTSWTNLSEFLTGTTAREQDLAFTARTHLNLSLSLFCSLKQHFQLK